MLQDYLACGEDSSQAIDFYGLNAYEWCVMVSPLLQKPHCLSLTLHRCGEATFETSGYIFLQKNASNYNIPIFFSETGCNVLPPRTFDDQATIFGDKMVDTWSGAIIYEWIQETNNYGLVSYPLSGDAPTGGNADAQFGRNGTPQPVNPDFENLSKHWAAISPTGIRADDYKPSLTPPPCPDYTSGAWAVARDAQLPTIGHETNSGSVSSSSSDSAISTAIATATGKAHPSESDDAQSAATATATKADEATKSSGAASGNLGLLNGPGLSVELCIGVYVALCGLAGVFFVL